MRKRHGDKKRYLCRKRFHHLWQRVMQLLEVYLKPCSTVVGPGNVVKLSADADNAETWSLKTTGIKYVSSLLVL
jgi:hypothetical protein